MKQDIHDLIDSTVLALSKLSSHPDIAHLSPEDHQRVKDAYATFRARRDKQLAQTLVPGAEVTFQARGVSWTGKVKKVNRKTVQVLATDYHGHQMLWRVAPSLLQGA